MEWLVTTTSKYYIKDGDSKTEAEYHYLNKNYEKVYENYTIEPIPTLSDSVESMDYTE